MSRPDGAVRFNGARVSAWRRRGGGSDRGGLRYRAGPRGYRRARSSGARKPQFPWGPGVGGVWHCAEWHVDASVQAYEFYYDGSQEIQFQKGAGNYDGSDLLRASTRRRTGRRP
jgi:hypothetical protein